MQIGIFLDRDNTLTIDKGYNSNSNQFSWVDGAPESLKIFYELSLPVFIVTNQGGIGRGFFSIEEMNSFHNKLIYEAKNVGGEIKDIAYCPHHPLAKIKKYQTPCRCRKPKPGMLHDLSKKWNIDLKNSILIGDKISDVEAGKAAGCKSYLFNSNEKLNVLVLKILKELNMLK